ncbi:MAG TPA: type VI secretion system Vgr family protein, partial [Steroidobacteraceae bacterium]|nr:type VI secretion system Vgr family protein [Steroidobacteraceae bacterium]
MANDATREYELTTPLGDDVLLLRKMWGVERMSAAYEWDLDLISTDGDINPDDLLGKHVSVGLQLNGGDRRYFSGIVSEFSTGGWLNNYNSYRAIVRPWFWLLTRTADCKIFQQKSVPQIFEDVVKEYGFTDYLLKLNGTYNPWEYCVQYRETDFNFLSRLLEQEGIYYYFEHEKDKHTLVLIDDLNNHTALDNYAKVPYYAPGGPNTQRERDHLEAWTWTKSVETGSFATTDFDFEKPKLSFRNASSISRPHAHADYEIFDYPSEVALLQPKQTEAISKVRIQELQAVYLRARGHGTAAGLAPGRTFTLELHPRPDLNMEYLVTQATYSLTGDTFESGQATTTEDFAIAVEAIDKKSQYRPERRTPKPVVQGAQTAMVVGQSGDEIYTDKYGRVKVQFHWDRYGEKDEHSSCWIRVSQLWAGKTWGGIHIPRIGQEVIVSFLEGDPDQPIITGRVYNGDSMPPYGLPANATQSGIKSRSSKGGSEADFNEFRFEDKKGSEQVYLHAQKNQDIVVENDETQSIGHDRTEKVGHDETITIGNNRTEKVG